MEVPVPRPKAPHDRRRQILEAAYRVALRQRVAGLSSRAVAAQAGVSNGLIFFYFGNSRALLLALLDWLLEETILRRAAERQGSPEEAPSRLAAEVRNALESLLRDRVRLELFFDFWFTGSHDQVIRDRIRTALERYRQSYLPLARSVVAQNPARYANVTAEALAGLVTAFLEGCALQLIAEPRNFDPETYSKALASLLGLPPASGESEPKRTKP